MIVERHAEVALLRLNAGKANAVNPVFLGRLNGLLDEAADAAAIVLTGYDRFYSAGLDFTTLLGFDREEMGAAIRLFDDTAMRLLTLPVPVVAAVNGHAIAGGCILALPADHRVLASASLRFGVNEVPLGLGFPPGALQVLRFAVPAERIDAFVLEGPLLDADTAAGWGVVHELAEPAAVVSRALEKAAELAALPQPAFAQVKAQLRRPFANAAAQDRDATTERWLDTWFDSGTQARIHAALDALKARKRG